MLLYNNCRRVRQFTIYCRYHPTELAIVPLFSLARLHHITRITIVQVKSFLEVYICTRFPFLAQCPHISASLMPAKPPGYPSIFSVKVAKLALSRIFAAGPLTTSISQPYTIHWRSPKGMVVPMADNKAASYSPSAPTDGEWPAAHNDSGFCNLQPQTQGKAYSPGNKSRSDPFHQLSEAKEVMLT